MVNHIQRRTIILLISALFCLSITPANTPAAVSLADDYATDFQALIDFIDHDYTFLALKGIEEDWATGKSKLLTRADICQTDQEFFLILYDTIRLLRDGHLSFRETRTPLPEIAPEYYPGISFLPAKNDQVIVMYPPQHLTNHLKPGTVITQINGLDAREYLEQQSKTAWQTGGFFSSPQRARLFEYRIPLRSPEKDATHHITYLDTQGTPTSITLQSNQSARGWPHTYHLPVNLKRVGRSFHFTKLAFDDIGYLYLRRVDTSITQGIAEARQAYPEARAWIVDLRGNGGGGYDSKLLTQIENLTQPVVVIIDAGCVSAGETLARDFRRRANAYLIGTQTAGSSSSKTTFTFPSGIASLTIPIRTRWRADNQPIEFNGITPDLVSEAIPREVQAGLNSQILRAQEYLRLKIPGFMHETGERLTTTKPTPVDHQ